LTDAVGNKILNTAGIVINDRYYAVYKNWGWVSIYMYKGMAMHFDNSVYLLDMSEKYFVTTRNASLMGFRTSNMTKNPFDLTDAPCQVAMTQECAQNFIRYTAVHNWLNWHFNATILPMLDFNYTVGALATVYPEIVKNYSTDTSIFVSCYDDALTKANLTFISDRQSIETKLRFICNILTNDAHQMMIYSFDFFTIISSVFRLDALGNSIATMVRGNIIGTVRTTYPITKEGQLALDYYVSRALYQMRNSKLTWGSRFYFPILNSIVNITSDYILLYGDYVPFPRNTDSFQFID